LVTCIQRKITTLLKKFTFEKLLEMVASNYFLAASQLTLEYYVCNLIKSILIAEDRTSFLCLTN
jgi:hypothetical protein